MGIAERRRQVRLFTWLFGAAQVGLLLTGLVLLVTRRPDSSATRIANKGLQSNAGPAGPLQDAHESLSLLMLVIVLVGLGWLMVRVKQDWSTQLALVLVATAAAAITGMLVRFETVQLDGVFVEDLRGYGFLFDGAFEQIGLGKRTFGANTYRVLVVAHLVSAGAMVSAAVSGVRDAVAARSA